MKKIKKVKGGWEYDGIVCESKEDLLESIEAERLNPTPEGPKGESKILLEPSMGEGCWEYDLAQYLMKPGNNLQSLRTDLKARYSAQTKLCIIVLGPPASGKTTLATKLAKHFAIPLISKDEYKERLFAGLEEPIDRQRSQALGAMSFDLLYLTAQKLAATGSGFVVEADFTRPNLASSQLGPILADNGYRAVMVNLYADGDVLRKRFEQRAAQGLRHPGHCDQDYLAETKTSLFAGKREYLTIPGARIAVDTTDLAELDCAALIAKIEQCFASADTCE